MTEQEMKDRLEMAEEVAGSCRAYLSAMYGPGGMPVEVVLSGAHAEVVALMVLRMGGAMTADVLRRAATQIESAPSLSEVALAMAEPEGQA